MTFVDPGMLTAVPAVITTRSPDSTIPLRRAASRERAQRSSTSTHSGISSGVTPHSLHQMAIEWGVTPLDRHLMEGVAQVREPDDRATRAQPCNGRRRPARESGNDNRLRRDSLGEIARNVRHRIADGWLFLGIRKLVAVIEARLDRTRDPVHV